MNYWKVKATEMEWRALQIELELMRERGQRTRDAVFVAEGLNPQGYYSFSDADETLRPVKDTTDDGTV